VRSIILLAIVVFIWGASWTFYKMALPYTPPLLFAGLRPFFGGLILALLILHRFDRLNFPTYWKIYIIAGLINATLFFTIQTIGLQYLPGGLFSVLVYSQPIFLSILAWLMLGEQLTLVKIIGLFFGFIGIIVASIEGVTVYFSVIGITLALLTGFVWAYGSIYVKLVSDRVDGYWLVAMQNMIGGGLILLFASFIERWTDIVWNAQFFAGTLYGVFFGVPIAFLIYYYLINEGEASKVGSATFLVPIISVIISAIVLQERLTVKLFIGMLLVGTSIYLVNRTPRTEKTPVSQMDG